MTANYIINESFREKCARKVLTKKNKKKETKKKIRHRQRIKRQCAIRVNLNNMLVCAFKRQQDEPQNQACVFVNVRKPNNFRNDKQTSFEKQRQIVVYFFFSTFTILPSVLAFVFISSFFFHSLALALSLFARLELVYFINSFMCLPVQTKSK